MSVYLLTLRQALQRALDDGSAYAVTSATSTTVVCNALKNATTGASAALYNGAHIYIASGAAAGQQRKVRTDGFAPSTGTLTVFPDWTITPSGGEILEITHTFPSNSAPVVSGVSGEDTSYRSILNRALANLAIPDRIQFAIGTGYSYPLTSYPWLNREERLRRVLEPGPTGGRAVSCMWRGPRLVLDGPTPALELDVPFENATGSLTLEVTRPGDTLIEVSGTFAESTVGLVNDTDRANVEIEDVIPEAMVVAYEALSARTPGRPYPGADKKIEMWRAEAAKQRYHDRSRQVEVAPVAAA